MREMKGWLAKYSKDIVAAFTIDGCKEAHDLNRSNSYDLVHKNIPFFKKYWPYQATKFTVNEKTIPYIAESVIHLENLLAACKLEALRLKQLKDPQLKKLSVEEKKNQRHRLDAIIDIIENVI